MRSYRGEIINCCYGSGEETLRFLGAFEHKKTCTDLCTGFSLYVTRFELATFWSVARRSIQLSYTYISRLGTTAATTKYTILVYRAFVK